MRKIVVAPDSFKECLTSLEVCEAIKEGFDKANKGFECEIVPMADGGEGTMEVIVHAKEGKIINTTVVGPLGKEIESKYGYIEKEKTAVIEIAKICGLELIKNEERNPEITTSYGVGQIFKKLLDKKVEKVIICLGGSCTNDGGFGMLQALGVSGKDKNGCEIEFGGKNLINLNSIDFSALDKRIKDIEIIAACDVTNPLVGKNGATFVFGKQKGADEKQLESLEKAMINYGNIVYKEINININDGLSCGAAGGLGAAFNILGATMKKGIEIVLKETDFENKVKDAYSVITGEGSIDSQTAYGKTISGVLNTAKKYDVPVIAIGGKVSDDIDNLYDLGLNAAFAISDRPKTIEESINEAYKSISKLCNNIARIL